MNLKSGRRDVWKFACSEDHFDDSDEVSYRPGVGVMCLRCAFELAEKDYGPKAISWEEHQKLKEFWGNRHQTGSDAYFNREA
jgi:hypothetical protein